MINQDKLFEMFLSEEIKKYKKNFKVGNRGNYIPHKKKKERINK